MSMWSPQALWAKDCQWWAFLSVAEGMQGRGRGVLESELAIADGVGGFGENHFSCLGPV